MVYLPATDGPPPAVHVNFHGGGYVLPLLDLDDPHCRFLAAEAGVAVVNVDYVVAPQHPFPAAPRQAFEAVRWVAATGAEHGWDGGRISVGGQSAGGGLAAAVARQALEEHGPPLALQVLHYPPLDLATGAVDKRAAIPKPRLRPWMAEVFDSSYVPDPLRRTDRLVSPANPADTADLRGISPALVITAAHDLLRAEGARYTDRLREAGALVDHHERRRGRPRVRRRRRRQGPPGVRPDRPPREAGHRLDTRDHRLTGRSTLSPFGHQRQAFRRRGCRW